MTNRASPARRAAGALAAAGILAALAGCGIAEAPGDEGDEGDEPSVQEVADRFASMTEIPGDPDGDTTIEATGPGTLWALTRRDDVSAADPGDCSLSGAVMAEPAEQLNTPEPGDLGAEGDPQTLFAFASAPIDDTGDYTATCGIDTPALLFLFEPAE